MIRLALAAFAALTVTTVADAQPLRRAVDRFRNVTKSICTGPECQAQTQYVPEGLPLPMRPPYLTEPAPTPRVAATTPQVASSTPQAVGAPRVVGLKVKLGLVRGKIVRGLVAKGVDRADAEKVVGQLGDGTLLKLLLEHLDDIAKIIERLLPLFMDDGRLS